MKLRNISALALALSLGACASVPPPPHCKDDGRGMQPINPEKLTQEQINAHRAAQKPTESLHPHQGDAGRGGLN